jgi:fatty acid-binding protein DegV
MAGIAVVTDSTAYLPSALAAEHDLTVVPISVVIGGREGLEGIDITPADVAKALVARRTSVTTSRPSPAEFQAEYSRLLDSGVDGIVSVHLSAKLSGTYDAAVLAAETVTGSAAVPAAFSPGGVAPASGSGVVPGSGGGVVPASGGVSVGGGAGGGGVGGVVVGGRIAVVDGRSAGMGLGFAAMCAAGAARSGADLDGVRQAALAVADRTTVLFYVDSLEYLRRGGRIGAAQALLGTALSVKPILHFVDGAIVVRDKVRTAGRAIARIIDLAVAAAGPDPVDIAVHHLGTPDKADMLSTEVSARLGDQVRAVYITEIGAAVAAHVGPGLLSVVIHRP